jgi:hypothetical protein
MSRIATDSRPPGPSTRLYFAEGDAEIGPEVHGVDGHGTVDRAVAQWQPCDVGDVQLQPAGRHRVGEPTLRCSDHVLGTVDADDRGAALPQRRKRQSTAEAEVEDAVPRPDVEPCDRPVVELPVAAIHQPRDDPAA